MSNLPVDVLLICPNYYSKVLITDAIVYPMNLAYLAAYLRDKGKTVSILDGRALNCTLEDYERAIRDLQPKLVGITVMTSYVNQAVEIAMRIKSVSRDIIIVVGGAHISALPDETLKSYECFDIAAVGEGEVTLYEITDKVLRKDLNFSDVDGIHYRDGDVIKFTKPRALIENLDSLPYPAYDLLPLEKYRPSIQWIKKRPSLMIYTARGCPFKCTFCASRNNFGNSVRVRSPESIIKEIVFYKSKYKIKQIIFYDDTLVINKKHINKLCDLMIENKLDLVWGCFSTIEAMDFELAKKMKRAGCFTIFFGLESGSEEILKIMKKNYKSPRLAKQVLKDVRKTGIVSIGTFIFGIPGETEETIRQTIEYALDLPISYAAFAPVVPFAGTQIFNYAREKEILPENITDWSNFEAFKEPFVLSEVSRDKLVHYTQLAYKKFYYRIPIICQIIKDNLSLYKIWHSILTGWRITQLIFSSKSKQRT